VFEAVNKGYLDPKPLHSSFCYHSYIISGFSLGPEVVTGMLAGGIAKGVQRSLN